MQRYGCHADAMQLLELIDEGWKGEGIGWYGYSADIKTIDFSNAIVDTSAKTYSGKQFTPSATITMAAINSAKTDERALF